jgi:hypothetical protein
MNRGLRLALALPVGTPIVLLVTVVICGGVEGAMLLILISVVCTLGIGALFWLAGAFFVGWVTLLFISLALESARGQPVLAEAVDRPRLSRDEIAVIDYMRHGQAAGFPAAQVDELLRRNGWTDAIIARARQMLAQVRV